MPGTWFNCGREFLDQLPPTIRRGRYESDSSNGDRKTPVRQIMGIRRRRADRMGDRR